MSRPRLPPPAPTVLAEIRALRAEHREATRLIATALAALREQHDTTRALVLGATDGLAEKYRRHGEAIQTHDAEISRLRRGAALMVAALFVGRRGPWAAFALTVLVAAIAWAR